MSLHLLASFLQIDCVINSRRIGANMRRIVVAIVLSTCAWSITSAQTGVNVPTNRNDAQRSGVNLGESLLSHDAVRHHLGKLWTLFSDAQIMAQPLYVSGLKTAAGTRCAAGCNVVIFASMKGTVYAYQAD